MSSLLKFVEFKDIYEWDVERYFNNISIKSEFDFVSLDKILIPRKEKIKKADYDGKTDIVAKISFKDGLIHLRDEKKTGMELYKLYQNDLLVSKINFHQGALAISRNKELVCSTHYQPYIINKDLILDKYLVMLLRSNVFKNYTSNKGSKGIKTEATYKFISSLQIPLPPLKKQKEIVNEYEKLVELANEQEHKADRLEESIEEYITNELGIEKQVESKDDGKLLKFAYFKDMSSWGVNEVSESNIFETKKYEEKSLKIFAHFPKRSWNKKEYKKDSFYYIDISSVNEEYGIFQNKQIKTVNTPSRATQVVMNGDLLISTTRPYLKSFGIVNTKYNNNICSSGFTIIEKNINYDNNFIKYFLQSEYGVYKLSSKMTGGLYPAITTKELKNLKIPLPPLKKQIEIAEHIEKIKDEVKSLRENAITNKELAIKNFESDVFNSVN